MTSKNDSKLRILVVDDDTVEISSVILNIGDKYEVLSGLSKTIEEAVTQVSEKKPDIVLLDFMFGDNEVGHEIAKRLDSTGFNGVVISYSTLPRAEQKQAYADAMPLVQHFVEKDPTAVESCLTGKCDCVEVVSEETERVFRPEKETEPVLLVASKDKEYALSLKQACSTLRSFQVATATDTAGFIEALIEQKPRVVLYEAAEYNIVDFYSVGRHDYYHRPDPKPDFDALLPDRTIMMSLDRDMAKDAAKRGHLFIKMPLLLTDLFRLIGRI